MARPSLAHADHLLRDRGHLRTEFRLWLLASAVLLLAASSLAYARVPVSRVPVHRDPWEKAVALRDKLEAEPSAQRTRERYEEVLNAFRDIYHEHPDAAKAPAAVAAVADLLAEKGRVLSNQGALRAAIGQYEFLRNQYPGSPQVDNALLLEAEICRQDLKDIACAIDKLRAVIEAEPNTSYSEQAALELKGMEPPASRSGKSGGKNSQKNGTSAAKAQPPPKTVPEIASDDAQLRGKGKTRTQSPEPQPDPPQPDLPHVAAISAPEPVSPLSADVPPSAFQEKAPSGRVVMITGMRHWSNPTSTRIAIDLGGKVEYEAARVPNPDRIFFDLHGARLAGSLNGRQVEVVDDGYLKRIRAAQFHPDVTRVVLDVTDVSDYSAFLLPNHRYSQ
jgi:N-acetylmuramoyl-L-alanine amidase